MRRIVIIVSLALLVATIPASAKELSFEYDYPVVSDRWGISLGGYLVDLDTTVAVGFGNVVGTIIKLEDILNLEESQDILRLEGFVRMAPKHALEFGLLQINRSANADILTDVLDFDEFEFTGSIDTVFNIDQLKTTYKYSFINNGQVNAGFSVGLSWFNLEATVSGNAELLDSNGDPIIDGLTLEETEERLLAPVPSLGMFVEYAPVKWFLVRMEAQFFDLDIGDLDFLYSDTRIVMDFYVTRHVGLGIGVGTTRLEYIDTGDDPLRVDFRFGGVLFHLSIAF